MKCPDCDCELEFITDNPYIVHTLQSVHSNVLTLASNTAALNKINFKIFKTNEEMKRFIDSKAFLEALLLRAKNKEEKIFKTINPRLNEKNIFIYRDKLYLHGDN